MAQEQARITFTNGGAQPTHTEENRLARRLFQLENRVRVLEDRVEEMGEMLQMLIMTDAFREGDAELSIGFCSCNADGDEDEDEDDSDEDEF